VRTDRRTRGCFPKTPAAHHDRHRPVACIDFTVIRLSSFPTPSSIRVLQTISPSVYITHTRPRARTRVCRYVLYVCIYNTHTRTRLARRNNKIIYVLYSPSSPTETIKIIYAAEYVAAGGVGASGRHNSRRRHRRRRQWVALMVTTLLTYARARTYIYLDGTGRPEMINSQSRIRTRQVGPITRNLDLR